MTISEYHQQIQELAFDEFPYGIHGGERHMSSFIEIEKADLDLKIHLCKVILRRCFSATIGDLVFPWDYQWFINGFFRDYKNDHIKPGLSVTMREAVTMIQAEEVFTKGIIATTFLFGVIEFYVKYELGFRPMEVDFFDARKKSYIRNHYPEGKKAPNDLSLGKAWDILMKQPSDIGQALKELDAHNLQRLNDRGIDPQGRWVYPQLSKRLSLFRNTMLHGEHHSFYSAGHYLLTVYALFHLCREKKLLNQANIDL